MKNRPMPWRVARYEDVLHHRTEQNIASGKRRPSPLEIAEVVAKILPVVTPGQVIAEVSRYYDFTDD